MRSLMILTALLLASFPGAAQDGSGARSSQYRPLPLNVKCPVVLRAERRAPGMVQETDGRSTPGGQGIQLNFLSKPHSQVVQIDLALHGYSGGLMLPLLSAGSTKEVVEDFHLAGTPQRPILEPTIWSRKMTAIAWIELTGVTFADGTVWQRTTLGECAFEPSLYVPVDAQP